METRIILTRAEIAQVLRNWQAGEMTAAQVHEWAAGIYFPGEVDFDDWEGDEQQVSAANEVLAALDMLDMNLIVAEDVPSYLAFLDTPIGRFDQGLEQLEMAKESIDYRLRQELLKDDPLYARYCARGEDSNE